METVSPAKLRVLVLDDNELVRSALHQLLTAKGFQVFSYPEPVDCPLRRSDRCRCVGAEVCADALITDLDICRRSAERNSSRN